MKANQITTKILTVLSLALLLLTSCREPGQNTSLKELTPTKSEMEVDASEIERVKMGLFREFAIKGRFTYHELEDYETTTSRLESVFMEKKDHSTFLSFSGYTIPQLDTEKQTQIVDAYLMVINNENNYTLATNGEPIPTQVDGIDCWLVPIAGKVDQIESTGLGFLAPLDGGHVVIGVGFSLNKSGERAWQKTGKSEFMAFVNSLQFIRQETVERDCPISTDPTYGYTIENPVKLGGGSIINGIPVNGYDGVSREDYYLMLLSGSNGESINVTRTGSQNLGDTILDEYVIAIAGEDEPRTIYVDIYHYSPPFAPVGFSCYDYLPFEEPR